MKKILVLLALLPLIYCSKMPEIHYYTIHYDFENKAAEPQFGTLFVKNIKTGPIYINDKLIYRESEYEIKFDHFRRWALTPAEMITNQTLEDLRVSGLFSRVTAVQPKKKDYLRLDGTLLQFEEIKENGKRFAVTSILYSLLDIKSEKECWTQKIENKVSINSSGAEGIVAAMSQSVKLTMEQLVQDLAKLDMD